MEPENLRFGGGLSHTIFSPVVALVVICAGLILWLWPRNKALVGFLVASILIPTDQVLVVGPLHFPVLRILILFGLARVFWAKFTSGDPIFTGGTNGIDKAVMLLAIFRAVDGVLLWREGGEVIYQLGEMFTAFGLYFILRFFIRDQEDVERTIRAFAYMMVFIAAIMAYEQTTGHNLIYSMLGGARAITSGSATERDDRFRAMGPFAHPILAGTFGAIMLPMFLGLWWKDKKNRNLALMGMLSCTVASFSANSSTALLGYVAGILALCMWPMRKLMRPVRWGIVITLVSLHMVMKAPVWHLISRIDISGGSSSYHRFELVNQCILHFTDWMVVGTKYYAEWGWDMWDLSNQYVAFAETGGLIPLILFIAIISLGFRYVGNARRASEGDKNQELLLWALGSSMFANVIAFFGISYFDQTIVGWYALLAIIPIVAAVGVTKAAPPAEVEIVRPGMAFRPHLVPGSARGQLSK